MCWKLYYLKNSNNEKMMNFERGFKDGELDLIYECNQILGDFNGNMLLEESFYYCEIFKLGFDNILII